MGRAAAGGAVAAARRADRAIARAPLYLPAMSSRIHPGAEAPAIAARLAAWRSGGVAARLAARDAALWTDAGIADTPGDPIAGRLGWVDLPASSRADVPGWRALARDALDDGVAHVVLLGMGGSSLGAEVLVRCLAPASGAPRLVVADSTHPAFVRAIDAAVDPAAAWYLAASKSGTTVETTAHLAHAVAGLAAHVDRPWSRVVAITDPGTPLAAQARSQGGRAVVDGRPDVGGRFSALSAFGLLPAALCGVDVAAVLDGAAAGRAALASGDGAGDDDRGALADASGVALGAALGEWAAAGRTTLALVAAPGAEAVPGWIEQLVAESLGKGGRGLFVRTLAAAPAPAEARADEVLVAITAGRDGARGGDIVRRGGEVDRRAAAQAAAGRPVVVESIDGAAALGGLLFRWEVATALAATVLGVQPFDQPDVESAKRLARDAMARRAASAAVFAPAADATAGSVADVDRVAAAWLAGLPPGAQIAVQAYLPPSPAVDDALAALAERLASRSGAPVAVGYGPRYLHSTGQLHKGGPPTVRCLQLVDASLGRDGGDDVPVPGAGYTFGQLCAAQAAGDAAALRAVGRAPFVVALQAGA